MFAEQCFCLPNFCGIVGRMNDEVLRWDLLAHWVRKARGARSQRSVHADGGPTDTTLGKIETGQWRPTRAVSETLDKLEKGLGWQPGDAARILRGGTPLDAPPLSRVEVVLLSQVPTLDLVDEIRRRVVLAAAEDEAQRGELDRLSVHAKAAQSMGDNGGVDHADDAHEEGR
jgi:hypothetical protein